MEGLTSSPTEHPNCSKSPRDIASSVHRSQIKHASGESPQKPQPQIYSCFLFCFFLRPTLMNPSGTSNSFSRNKNLLQISHVMAGPSCNCLPPISDTRSPSLSVCPASIPQEENFSVLVGFNPYQIKSQVLHSTQIIHILTNNIYPSCFHIPTILKTPMKRMEE